MPLSLLLSFLARLAETETPCRNEGTGYPPHGGGWLEEAVPDGQGSFYVVERGLVVIVPTDPEVGP